VDKIKRLPRTPRRRKPRWSYDALRRAVRYRFIIPVFRSSYPAEHTARGVANGVFWGLTPSVGLQTLEIVTTWFVARRMFGKDSSLLQAFVWVWVNNPLTMFPLYYAFYVTGVWLIGDAGEARSYGAFVDLWDATAETGWRQRVGTLARAVGVPTVVGSIPYAAAGSAMSYRWAVRILRQRQKRRRERPSMPDPVL
jgi:uncharacterized protein (DUF2062 family)